MQSSNQSGFISETVVSILVVIGIIVGIFFITDYLAHAIPSYNRGQRLADERNQVQVNDIQIAQTKQLVQVEQQKAQVRIAQAQGIAQAQHIIAGSLTQAYLQYEAIEAQKNEINSQNHTIIYIPSGNNGVPLVSTVNPQQ